MFTGRSNVLCLQEITKKKLEFTPELFSTFIFL